MKRLYDCHRWRKARSAFLSSNPLCVKCLKFGRDVPATVVDHIIPHENNLELFWDSESNWQALCAACHGAKRAEENKGATSECDADGMPLNLLHHWNK